MAPNTPRERILATATQLFAREGIKAVGVNRIIEEAQVAPMTLYRQFGGKDALVAAVVERWGTEWLQWLVERIEAAGDDPAARLERLWAALQEWVGAEGLAGSLMANAAAELRGEPGHPVQRVIAAHRVAVRQVLEELAKAAGVGDPVGMAGQLQVLVDGAVAAAVTDGTAGAVRQARSLAAAALAAASA